MVTTVAGRGHTGRAASHRPRHQGSPVAAAPRPAVPRGAVRGQLRGRPGPEPPPARACRPCCCAASRPPAPPRPGPWPPARPSPTSWPRSATEIRTPLNSILGFAALVADDPNLSPENRRRLDLVGRAGHSLAEIVGDLLDFAKVEAGRLDLTLAPTSPAALLRDAVAILAPEAAAKGLYLRTVLAAEGQGDVDQPLALDETRLRQVLMNLLANALKFTAQGGVAPSSWSPAGAGRPAV
ncbi:sensor histidine kinase [Caulobacter segnis]